MGCCDAAATLENTLGSMMELKDNFRKVFKRCQIVPAFLPQGLNLRNRQENDRTGHLCPVVLLILVPGHWEMAGIVAICSR